MAKKKAAKKSKPQKKVKKSPPKTKQKGRGPSGKGKKSKVKKMMDWLLRRK